MTQHMDQAFSRITGGVDAVLDAVANGEDPTPEIQRLQKMQPWVTARMSIAAMDDSIERTREADAELESTIGGAT